MSKMWHYHLIAILVVLTWGVTFVNSKVLLNHGLEAHEIFTLRFLLAYICIWIFFLAALCQVVERRGIVGAARHHGRFALFRF